MQSRYKHFHKQNIYHVNFTKQSSLYIAWIFLLLLLFLNLEDLTSEKKLTLQTVFLLLITAGSLKNSKWLAAFSSAVY